MNGKKSTGVLHQQSQARPRRLQAKRSAEPTSDTDFPFSRGARIGFLFLLLVTILFASGALFIKYQLENYRVEFEQALEDRMGAQLTMGTVSVNGLRGFRIDGPRIEYSVPDGPIFLLTAPVAFIDINLNDLFYGQFTVSRIALDNAHILIDRPDGAIWYNPQKVEQEELVPANITDAFRITGRDCQLRIDHIVGDTSITMTPFHFDLARLADAPDIVANLQGDLSGDAEKHIDMKLNLASLQDFDLRVQTDLITAEDVNVFLPSPQHLVAEGTAQPYIRLSGLPGNLLMLSLQAPFEDIRLRDHPEFLDPADGTLTVLATYTTDTRLLTITTAKAESRQLSGAVDGAISFASDYPAFDVQLKANKMPLPEILNYALDGEIEKYGELEFAVNEPHELILRLEGTSQKPIVKGTAKAASGEIAFRPEREGIPPIQLTLGQMEGTWDSTNREISGTFNVSDGEMHHEGVGVTVRNIVGAVSLADGTITADPLNMMITNNDFVGSLRYVAETGDVNATLRGTLSGIEHTEFHNLFEDVRLGGDIGLNAKVAKRGDRYAIDAQLDATQTAIDYEWWFRKPPGVGVNGNLTVDYTADESAKFDGTFEIASSHLSGTAYAEYTGDEWSPMYATATSDKIDLTAVQQCLHLPYRLSGGIGTNGHFSWRRSPERFDHAEQEMGLHVDELHLLPLHEKTDTPLIVRDCDITVAMAKADQNTGTLEAHAADASVPPFGQPMFVSLDAYRPEQYHVERSWDYQLNVDRLNYPPWNGRNFTAKAYSTPASFGFKNYSGEIDDGRLSGTYDLTRQDNSYTAEIHWTDVSAHYFLEHLGYPDVLSGTISGEVDYALDKDDPNTLTGGGTFEISDGRFSADFLYSIFEDASEEEMVTLPPSLEFHSLNADVRFDKDLVRTPMLTLDAKSLALEGAGHYVRDGDMDYTIKIAIAPDLADDIPGLENLNIQGYRIAGQDIELGFKIDGPTFNPRGKLAELPPASVTFVSGALEATGEALKVLDAPRKILVDLLRMGGGIVGGRQVGGGRDTSE